MNRPITEMNYESLNDERLIERALKLMYAETYSDLEDDKTIKFRIEDKVQFGIYERAFNITVEIPEFESTETGTARFAEVTCSAVLIEMNRPACQDTITAMVNLDNNYIYWF